MSPPRHDLLRGGEGAPHLTLPEKIRREKPSRSEETPHTLSSIMAMPLFGDVEKYD